MIPLVTLTLLFLPKINVIELAGHNAGIRLDDVVLGGLLLYFFFSHLILKTPLSRPARLTLGFFVVQVVSFLLALILYLTCDLNTHPSLFYVVRMPEYFTFFFVASLVDKKSLMRVVKALFVWQIVLGLAQSSGVLGGFGIGGFRADILDRVIGSCSHPTEYATLVSLLAAILILSQESVRVADFVIWIAAGGVISLSGSRIALGGLSLMMAAKLFRGRSLRKAALAGIVCVGIGCLVTLALPHTELGKRSAHLFTLRNIHYGFRIAKHADIHKTSMQEIAYEKAEDERLYEVSWLIRARKWGWAIKTYLVHPEIWLTGLGPGSLGSAVDGGWVRLLVENGILGLFFFIYLFTTMPAKSYSMKWMVSMMGINMLFIDTYLSYKPMSLVFCWGGAQWQKTENDLPSPSPEPLLPPL